MITISVLGLDQFVVGRYSKDHSANLAQLFECTEDDIIFYSPNASIFHKGVDQTSWNTMVIVRAPHKYEAVMKQVGNYLLKTLSEFSINVQVEFAFYEGEHFKEKINEDYPRFIESENLVDIEEESETAEETEEEDGEGPDPRDRADLDPNDPNQIFLGNAMESVEEKMGGKKSGKK